MIALTFYLTLKLVSIAWLTLFCTAAKENFMRLYDGDEKTGSVIFWLGIFAIIWLSAGHHFTGITLRR